MFLIQDKNQYVSLKLIANKMSRLTLISWVAVLLVGHQFTYAVSCSDAMKAKITLPPVINGWGINAQNHRFISELDGGISKRQLADLKVKWVFALPDTKTPHTQPLITPDTVFIGDEPGMVYALDRETGCEKWRFDAESTVRTALRYVALKLEAGGGHLLTFGTANGEVFGINVLTGQLKWRMQAENHSKTMVSGSSVEHDGVLYQPVSSWEAMWALNPFYPCCNFRSSVLALKPESGEIIWRAYVIEEEPRLVEERFLRPDRWGPSGAPVWSQPAIDAKRNRLYVGTGENYSSPATDTSDAILAFDLTTGEMLWKQQFLANDAWNTACESPFDGNCPSERGEDLDFGAPPILIDVNGKDIILAGQKSGHVYALDPDRNGELLWKDRPGTGGKLGGIHFSMAVDPQKHRLYVPISDRPIKILGDNPEGIPNPSLHAYDIATGEKIWATAATNICISDIGERKKNCDPGLSAAITATENLVFAPSLDGYIRVFDANDGAEIWSYDTNRSFDAVNGGKAKGGAIDLGGVYLNRGQLFLNAGYGTFDQAPGNAFIVLEVAD